MLKRFSTDTLNWILIIGGILLIFEIVFFFGGTIVPAIFAALVVYFGWRKFYHLWGKIAFWIGAVILVLSILNLMAVRFLLVALIVLFIINFSKTKKEPTLLAPDSSTNRTGNEETVNRIEPLFTHRLFGDQDTSEMAYKWRDINIHGGFGDRLVDLSNTVLPNDTAVISIRHMIGNIQIYVPYEVEVSIHHSSVFGRAHVFGETDRKLMNQSLIYQTAHYDTKLPRVKIITSIFSGDIEVVRI
ncbi:cell wall-active antibiotics response protein LiaF [Oceanobacillus manasiensis]|uniref:cell wall-active antibiotics response protein LiaF n=1 Tax=Oceanobacillus manasiensis TaxID=586413 RepID=UPI0005A82BA2|nr:cell wall-active antibiotics response protein LiaF [Oceanobacillus manasiensis]